MLVYLVHDDGVSRREMGKTIHRLGHAVKYLSPAQSLATEDFKEPGCIIVDASSSNDSGIELLEFLYYQGSTLPVIAVSEQMDVPSAVRAMKLGACDVLVKPARPDALALALQQSAATLKRHADRHHTAMSASRRLGCLTRREKDVLSGLVKGLPNKSIGYDLGISSRTVEIHRAHLMSKLNVRSLSELLKIVYDAESDASH